MRKLWTIRWFRVLLGVVLTAALTNFTKEMTNDEAGDDADLG